VTLYEILEVEGGAVYAGEGSALFTVKFSMVRASRCRTRTPLAAGPRVRTRALCTRCFHALSTLPTPVRPPRCFFAPSRARW
jgi:hypothetical protein